MRNPAPPLSRYLSSDEPRRERCLAPLDPWPGAVPERIVRALNEHERAVIDFEFAYRRQLLEHDTWRHHSAEYPDPAPPSQGETHSAAQRLRELAAEHAHGIKQAQIRTASRWAAAAILTLQALSEHRVPRSWDVLYAHGVQEVSDVLDLLAPLPMTHEPVGGVWIGDRAWPGAQRLKAAADLVRPDEPITAGDVERHRAEALLADPVPILQDYALACHHWIGQFAVTRDYDPEEFARASRLLDDKTHADGEDVDEPEEATARASDD